jgi:mannitol 2-dehydrogenase
VQISQQARLYERANLKCGILHMSVGGFHRAHMALYVDELMRRQPQDWLIAGTGLLDADRANLQALAAQDHRYTLVERSGAEDRLKFIGSIKETLHAPSDPARLLKRLQDPAIRIVSLTLTEKGYCAASGGVLDDAQPGIQHDLRHLDSPRTGIGYLVSGLRNRMQSRLAPFTVMSCDNLPGNGRYTRSVVLQFAALIDPSLAAWIEDMVRFPNAMVDRITPVTTAETVSFVRQRFGIEDAWPVVCEEFRQWVLEDDFADGRPALEEVGVQMVGDVEPYETMKIRLLNGSHSALAYLSYLAGFRDVDRAMADPLIARFVRRYMDTEVTPTLLPVPGIDLASYKETLLRRFANRAISDKVQRLAEDGSQKIPNSILPCVRHNLRTGGSIAYACRALAGWLRYMAGEDEQGRAIEIEDMRKDRIVAALRAAPDDVRPVLGLADIFGSDLRENPRFTAELSAALATIRRDGVVGLIGANN